MTQTGSMGLISAELFTHGTPGRNSEIMGNFCPYHKTGPAPLEMQRLSSPFEAFVPAHASCHRSTLFSYLQPTIEQ